MRIAEESGGQFFYQPKSVAMGEVIQVIDKLQKSELESRPHRAVPRGLSAVRDRRPRLPAARLRDVAAWRTGRRLARSTAAEESHRRQQRAA